MRRSQMSLPNLSARISWHRPRPGRSVLSAVQASGFRLPASGFRLWHTVAADMAPIPVINRGFGGSQLTDIRRYAARIVSTYEPRIVVVYAGKNDLHIGERGLA
jgi:hypothetical protein